MTLYILFLNSFVNEPPGSKFRIHPSTGVVTASSSLASDSGRLFHLEVLARDKGNPPQSATGLVEIRIGETRDAAAAAAALRFQNSTYTVLLPENAPAGRDAVQVRISSFHNKFIILCSVHDLNQN